MKIKNLKIKLFADGANKRDIVEMNNLKHIKGFTTNPSLMRKEGVKNYQIFAKEILKIVDKKPISFEVFSDNINEMKTQAKKISNWAKNVYVKIPVTNTKKKETMNLIKQLSNDGIKLNITAIFTKQQIKKVAKALNPNTPAIISVFAGRIADTGVDPKNLVKFSLDIFSKNKNHQLLWASTRELYNIFEANSLGCQIITVTPDILRKLKLVGYNLKKYSLDTVKDFHRDAVSAGYKL